MSKFSDHAHLNINICLPLKELYQRTEAVMSKASGNPFTNKGKILEGCATLSGYRNQHSMYASLLKQDQHTTNPFFKSHAVFTLGIKQAQELLYNSRKEFTYLACEILMLDNDRQTEGLDLERYSSKKQLVTQQLKSIIEMDMPGFMIHDADVFGLSTEQELFNIVDDVNNYAQFLVESFFESLRGNGILLFIEWVDRQKLDKWHNNHLLASDTRLFAEKYWQLQRKDRSNIVRCDTVLAANEYMDLFIERQSELVAKEFRKFLHVV